MLQSTPAKQDRYERHLMRQRGAGVRPLAANFAFSFDFAAPTSSDPVSVAEPPAKRRKTVAHGNPPQVAKDGFTAYTQNKTGGHVEQAQIVKKPAKSRRRLPVDTADEPSGPAPVEAGEDSFIANARPRTGRIRRKAEEPAAVNEAQVVERGPVKAKDRTRRRSEEPTVVSEPVKAEITGTSAPVAVDGRPKGRSAARRKTKPVKTTKKAGRKPAHSKRQRLQDDHLLDDENIVCPNPRTDRLPAAGIGEHATGLQEQNVQQPLLETDANVVRRSVSPAKLRERDGLAKKSRRAAPAERETMSTGEAELQNVNDVEASRGRGLKTEANMYEAGSALQTEAQVPNPRSMKSTRLRKLRIDRDDEGADTETPDSKMRDDELRLCATHKPRREAKTEDTAPPHAAESTQAPKASVRVVDCRSAAALLPARKAAMVASAKTKAKQEDTGNAAVKTLQKATATAVPESLDDDVDWLFAPQTPRQQSKPSAKPVKNLRKRGSFAKLADIDLDDLVTNIASLAPAPPANERKGLSQASAGRRARK